MKTLAGNGCRQSDLFPSTHWSVVLAAGRSQAEPEIAQAALAELCQTYWAPLYSFVRSRGYTVHDAQDLTQSFFAYLIEHKIYKGVDEQKGRFRSFLLASMKNFLADASDRERTLKRGGGQSLLPLHEEQIKEAESLFQNHRTASTEELIFDRSWAEALVSAALERLSAVTESTLRSHVTRLRARYREVLRAEVRRTVDTEAEVDEELHALLHVLTGG